jgi:mitochondrial fission protein ELM1
LRYFRRCLDQRRRPYNKACNRWNREIGRTVPQHADIGAELDRARRTVAGRSAWVLTDGKAGDVVHCLGVAERLGLAAEQRIVHPRPLFAALMPLGPIDPAEAPDRPGSPLAAPFPDIAIASGRRAVAYLRALKRASGGRTFTVFLKDPRTGAKAADFIWVPEHDRLRGANVLATLTSPHRITPQALDEARRQPPPAIAALSPPRAALLLGGDSKAFRFSPHDIARLAAACATLAAQASLMVTASRRTPPALTAAIRDTVATHGGFFWDGSGDNPYRAMLANADCIVATADSVNMVGEAVATGRPVLVFTPGGGTAKIHRFLDGLSAQGAVRPFTGRLETYTYPAIDATPLIAIRLAAAFTQFLQQRAAAAPGSPS